MNKDFVKRIIGLEGEKVEIRDKQVFVDDKPLDEPYKVHNDTQVYSRNDSYHYDDLIRDNFGPVVVPPGHCFAMGDNRDNSADSRYWGFLPLDNIKGRPWVIYFSYKAERDAWQKNGRLGPAPQVRELPSPGPLGTDAQDHPLDSVPFRASPRFRRATGPACGTRIPRRRRWRRWGSRP